MGRFVARRGDSLYYARLHSVFANTRFGLTNRLDLLMIYYYIVDRGAPTVSIGPNDFVSAFPLRRHNPEARLAYRFNNNVTGNVAYRLALNTLVAGLEGREELAAFLTPPPEDDAALEALAAGLEHRDEDAAALAAREILHRPLAERA